MRSYSRCAGLLIVISMTKDTVARIHSRLPAHQFEGLLRRARLGGLSA